MPLPKCLCALPSFSPPSRGCTTKDVPASSRVTASTSPTALTKPVAVTWSSQKIEVDHRTARSSCPSSTSKATTPPNIPIPFSSPAVAQASAPASGHLHRSEALLRNRDYIAFEQRGTHFAQPNLECEGLGESIQHAYLEHASVDEAVSAAIRQCRAKLTQQGIDLSAYTPTRARQTSKTSAACYTSIRST